MNNGMDGLIVFNSAHKPNQSPGIKAQCILKYCIVSMIEMLTQEPVFKYINVSGQDQAISQI